MSATAPSVVLIPAVKTTEDAERGLDSPATSDLVVTGPVLDDLPRVYSVYVFDGEYAGFIMGVVGTVAEKNGNAIYTWQHIGEAMCPHSFASLDSATDALIAASPMPSESE